MMQTDYISNIEYRTGDNSVLNSSLNLLPWQFRNSPNIIKILTIVATMKQRLDDVVVDVAKYRLISTAYGQQLDNIGAELGVERKGTSDEDYRIVLQIRMLRRKSQGTRPNIVNMVSRVTGLSEQDIDIYVGLVKTTDVYIKPDCIDNNSVFEELSKMFPIITSYRVVDKVTDTPLGFCSVNDTTEEINALNFGGFASVSDLLPSGGTIGSLVATSA